MYQLPGEIQNETINPPPSNESPYCCKQSSIVNKNLKIGSIKLNAQKIKSSMRAPIQIFWELPVASESFIKENIKSQLEYPINGHNSG